MCIVMNVLQVYVWIPMLTLFEGARGMVPTGFLADRGDSELDVVLLDE
jgi:hypothetical protein